MECRSSRGAVDSLNYSSATSCRLTHVVTASSFVLMPNGNFAVLSLISLPCRTLWRKRLPTGPDMAPNVSFPTAPASSPERPRALRRREMRARTSIHRPVNFAMMPSRPLRSASSKTFVPMSPCEFHQFMLRLDCFEARLAFSRLQRQILRIGGL